jgi:AcrR family transcriptional regulator
MADAVTVRRDRRAERHASTRAEILDAAWQLARERGLGGWSLRDVAEAVGMRAPSLYGYFPSKNAVFDAMFAAGYRDLLAGVDALEAERADASPVELFAVSGPRFFDFCVSDPARFQLLFLRTIPGFEPSAESYALALAVLDRLTAVLVAAGLGDPPPIDLWTALLTGLAAQQISNDPGGDRWRRLVEPATAMFLREHLPEAPPSR